MNDLFFFIKFILKNQPNKLIYFIIFNIIPKEGIKHFHDSIYKNLFIDKIKKQELIEIFFKAAYYRYKIKRLVHLYRWKKAKNADITMDLYKNPLSKFPKNQKITILQDKMIFTFRLTDLLTMWVTSLMQSDNLFINPASLKNPYTSTNFKTHNLYNIYFALHHSSFHIPSLLSNFFSLEFSLVGFKIKYYPNLQDFAIKNYYGSVNNEDKFIDILNMLDEYDISHNLRNNIISDSHQSRITKDLYPLLHHYYITQYSPNTLLKRTTAILLGRQISKYLSTHSLEPRSFHSSSFNSTILE